MDTSVLILFAIDYVGCRITPVLTPVLKGNQTNSTLDVELHQF
jgi:hypothetical protein